MNEEGAGSDDNNVDYFESKIQEEYKNNNHCYGRG